jgi:hypothetical protein
MWKLLLILVLAVFAAGLAFSIHRVFIRPKARGWLRAAFVAVLLAGIGAAWFSTYRVEYFANADTRVHGWPIPCVVFQRDTPDGPFWDYVGPTVFLAWPMNFLVFAFLPALVFTGLTAIRSFRARAD